IALRLPLRIQAVGESVAFCVLWQHLAVREDAEVSARASRNRNGRKANSVDIFAVEISLAKRLAVVEEAAGDAGPRASCGVERSVGEIVARVAAEAEEANQAVVVLEQTPAGSERHLGHDIPACLAEQRIVAIDAL